MDGLQRLTAFKDFLTHDMALEGLEYLVQYNEKRFGELPRPLRRLIEESQVTVHLIQTGTPPEVKFNIFRRVNTGGLVLTPQEIRHALNQGPAVNLLTDLATSSEFLDATTYSIPTDRMGDREFVLRFLAFSISDYTEYRVADMDAFLSVQMGRLNRSVTSFGDLKQRFARAMVNARVLFGKHAFRKLYDPQQSRSPINKALFETWSVALGKLSESESRILVSRREQVLNEAIHLNNNEDFYRAISQGTADVSRVKKRFSAVESLIASVVKGTQHD